MTATILGDFVTGQLLIFHAECPPYTVSPLRGDYEDGWSYPSAAESCTHCAAPFGHAPVEWVRTLVASEDHLPRATFIHAFDRWRGECACGWLGDYHSLKATALADAHAHLRKEA